MSLYSRVLQELLLPSYDFVRGSRHSHYRALVEKSQWWSQDRILDFQWQELRKLLRYAFDSVPFYQEKYRAAGACFDDIRSWDDFARLPTLSREEITQHRDRLYSRNDPRKLIAHATGGSSGVPLRFYITRPSFEWRCAVSERAYSWTGADLGERTLYLWGAAVGHQNRGAALKMRLFRTLRRERMFSTFSQNEELWKRIYEYASQWNPLLIVGYVSSLEEFAVGSSPPGKPATCVLSVPLSPPLNRFSNTPASWCKTPSAYPCSIPMDPANSCPLPPNAHCTTACMSTQKMYCSRRTAKASRRCSYRSA